MEDWIRYEVSLNVQIAVFDGRSPKPVPQLSKLDPITCTNREMR